MNSPSLRLEQQQVPPRRKRYKLPEMEAEIVKLRKQIEKMLEALEAMHEKYAPNCDCGQCPACKAAAAIRAARGRFVEGCMVILREVNS